MTSDQVKAIYERFFRLGGPPSRFAPSQQYRRRMTSLRLPGCQLLASLVQERKPRLVLDLGSGMSTIILRELQKETGMAVVTTDTSQRWLDTTYKELLRDELNTDYCFEQTEFEALHWKEPFDLVCVDCGNTDYRLSIASKVAGWCARDGIIVCDDYRLRNYGPQMADALKPFGFTLVERPETEDEFGQTLGTAEAS